MSSSFSIIFRPKLSLNSIISYNHCKNQYISLLFYPITRFFCTFCARFVLQVISTINPKKGLPIFLIGKPFWIRYFKMAFCLKVSELLPSCLRSWLCIFPIYPNAATYRPTNHHGKKFYHREKSWGLPRHRYRTQEQY